MIISIEENQMNLENQETSEKDVDIISKTKNHMDTNK